MALAALAFLGGMMAYGAGTPAAQAAGGADPAASEEAGPAPADEKTDRGDAIVWGKDLEVAAGQTLSADAVVINGSANVRGKVLGNVVVVNGSVHLYDGCSVKGDVVTIGGQITRGTKVTVGGSKVQIGAPWAAKLAGKLQAEAKPAEAKPAEAPAAGGEHGTVRYGSPVTVAEGETHTGDLVSMGGPVEVFGRVTGDVVSVGGPVTVSGEVDGDVVAVGGQVDLNDGARVNGDVVGVGGPVNKHPGAHVAGEVVSGPNFLGHLPWGRLGQAGRDRIRYSADFGALAALELVGFICTILVVLLVPRPTDTVARGIAAQPGRAFLFGLVGWLLILPVTAVLGLLVITWLVMPFYLLGLLLVFVLAYAAVRVLVGRWVARPIGWHLESVLGAAIVGLLVLGLVHLVMLVPVLQIAAGVLVFVLATMGFGGVLMTRFGTDPTSTWLGRRLATSPPAPTWSQATPADTAATAADAAGAAADAAAATAPPAPPGAAGPG
jgi:cytoskeletal protein CcmA (bactofilin family)